jgi:hypothetical protein
MLVEMQFGDVGSYPGQERCRFSGWKGLHQHGFFRLKTRMMKNRMLMNPNNAWAIASQHEWRYATHLRTSTHCARVAGVVDDIGIAYHHFLDKLIAVEYNLVMTMWVSLVELTFPAKAVVVMLVQLAAMNAGLVKIYVHDVAPLRPLECYERKNDSELSALVVVNAIDAVARRELPIFPSTHW